MLIIGTHFFTWGSEQTTEMFRCGQCGVQTHFVEKSGMRFITVFFIIPIIPISGVSKMMQCPNCKAHYQANNL